MASGKISFVNELIIILSRALYAVLLALIDLVDGQIGPVNNFKIGSSKILG